MLAHQYAMRYSSLFSSLFVVSFLGGCSLIQSGHNADTANLNAPHRQSADDGLKVAVDIVMARLRDAENGDVSEIERAAPQIYQLAAALMPTATQTGPQTGPRTLGDLQRNGNGNGAHTAPAAPALGETMHGAQIRNASYNEAKAAALPPESPPESPPELPNARSLMHAVHIGSYRTAERAFTGYRQLAAKAPAQFARLNPRVERVDLGPEKGIFERLKAGPFANKDAAESTCRTLRAHGVYCTVSDFTGIGPH